MRYTLFEWYILMWFERSTMEVLLKYRYVDASVKKLITTVK